MSGQVAEAITHADVERALTGDFRSLRFPRAIEARFESETGRARYHHLIWAMLAGLVLYNASLGADQSMLPDVFFDAVLVKLGLVTPTILIASYVLSRYPPVWLRETIVVATGIATSFAILFLILRSNAVLASHAHYPTLLCVVFVNVVLRARFWYACASSFVLMSAYTASLAQLDQLAGAAAVSAAMLLSVTTIATLVANYSLEKSERRAYLIRLRDQIRTGHLTLANRELNRISNLDSTTGLTNRRGFDARLQKLWDSALRSGQHVAVLMLDVDRFKRFNDRYGHQAGDVCLKEVAETARGELRHDDQLIARYGGEEFVILLPGAGLDAACGVAERVRCAIEQRGIRHEAAPLGIVTVSIGVAAAVAAATDSPRDLIEAADTALYAAKGDGRNRVWPPPCDAPHVAGSDPAGLPHVA